MSDPLTIAAAFVLALVLGWALGTRVKRWWLARHLDTHYDGTGEGR